MGGVHHPQHTQTVSNSSTIAAGSSNGVTIPDAVDTVVCAPDDGWRYHPKHVEQFPDINKLCYSCILLDIYWNIFTMHGPINVKCIDTLSYGSQNK